MAQNTADPRSPSDEGALLARLLTDPGLLDEDAVFWADGRVLPDSDPSRRTVLGWHRRGGPLVAGVTTGVASEALLVEALRLAERSAGWPLPRWDAAIEAYRRTMDPALRERVAERWGMPVGGPWTAATWARLSWGREIVGGPAQVGVVAKAIPESMRRAIDWLSTSGSEVAAWEVRRAGRAGPDGLRASRVAGRWADAPERPLPAAEIEPPRWTRVSRHGDVTAELVARIERLGRERGSEITWSGGEWVRIDGPERSLRVFPGTGGVDIQLIGADEGALTGLRFRYGVPVSAQAPPGAPPEVHLRLRSPDDFHASVQMLLIGWLGERSEGNGAPTDRASRRSLAPGPGSRDR